MGKNGGISKEAHFSATPIYGGYFWDGPRYTKGDKPVEKVDNLSIFLHSLAWITSGTESGIYRLRHVRVPLDKAFSDYQAQVIHISPGPTTYDDSC